MNFYGSETTEQHTLAGRAIPLMEAMWFAVSKAVGQPAAEPMHSKILPVWTHNLCDKLTTTIFKGLVTAAPRDQVVKAHNYGYLIGILLRGVVFWVKEAPEKLKQDGLMDLTPEQDKKLEQVAGLPVLFAAASAFFQKPITDGDALMEAGADRTQKKVEEMTAQFLQMGRHLLNRPIEEQCEFLNGIAKGFRSFLNPAGEFAGDKRRVEVYLALLRYWPEIAEMQQAEPPKTRKDLLDWLEKAEGQQFSEDPKNFYTLCDEIDLDLAGPGHPFKAPVG